jgi:hypothetical protein
MKPWAFAETACRRKKDTTKAKAGTIRSRVTPSLAYRTTSAIEAVFCKKDTSERKEPIDFLLNEYEQTKITPTCAGQRVG